MNNINVADWDAMRRAEQVLRRHGVGDERQSYNQGDRPKKKIDAIIRDIQAANAGDDA